MSEIFLRDYLNVEEIHRRISNDTWKYEDESGDKIMASLRIELLESVFLCLFIWGYDKSIDLECTEGLGVNSLFYVRFKKKTKLKKIKETAADMVKDLIEKGRLEMESGSKDFTIFSLR
ncbi:hypothetical protein J7K50_02870 [bacterium]|nr:hypothetical protein [bacterium]